jgi:beta-lactamase class A
MILIPTAIVPIQHYLHGLRRALHLSKKAAHLIAVTSVVAGLSFLVINAVLLSMQITSLPLFLKAGNLNLSLKTPAEAKELLNTYGQSQVLSVNLQGRIYSAPASMNGVKLDTDATLQAIQHPSGWNKIPLVYAIHNHRSGAKLRYSLNSLELKRYVNQISLPAKQKAVDAKLVIPSDVQQMPYITPEKLGFLFTVDGLLSQISQEINENQSLAVIAGAQILQPKVSGAQLNAIVGRVSELLARDLTITNGQASYKFTQSDLRKIVIVDTSDIPQAGISQKEVVELLRAHSNIFYTPPVSNQVKTLDGKVIDEKDGSSGRAINIQASAVQIVQALEGGQTTQTVTMAQLSPGTNYLRNYTATSSGLQALIKDYAATHRGTYAVATFELNDNRSAFYNQNISTVPASTYKLFVAYVALKKIEQGALSFKTQTAAGTLDSCMQKVILVSDNTCAWAILDLMGWNETQKQIEAAGFSYTKINNSVGGYMKSTANDLAKLLKGFYNGTLLQSSSTDYLFKLMKHQIYRSGIPAGSPGANVADKVGFLNSWNHDAAIVYAPHSTYVLVIMTTNAGFTQIKELSNQIYNLYNQ